jgi:hypothetical protein
MKQNLKNIILTFLFIVSLCCTGQTDSNEEIVIPLETESKEVYLTFVENVGKAKEIAIQDISNNKIKLLLAGGIGPVIYFDDVNFEKRYQVSYFDYGCNPPKSDVIIAYNCVIFDYLKKKYGVKWTLEVRDDIIGLKGWEKKNNITKLRRK